MLSRVLLFSLPVLHGLLSVAQGTNVSDTLTAGEKAQFINASMRTAVGYYQQAITYSAKKDTANTAKCLLKVDPYYFMFLGQNPDSINTFLIDHFKLSQAIREEYVALFTKTFNGPRSEVYTKFKMMYDEDRSVRRLIDRCADSFTCLQAKKRLFKTDSQHAEYLYNYVVKNGWPSLADGSLYANTLAIHDHWHHKDYISALKKAILNSNATIDVLEVLLLWNRPGSDLAYLSFADTLRTHNYRRYDVSAILQGQLPSMPKIEKTVKQFSHVKLYFFYESRNTEAIDIVSKKFKWEDMLTKIVIDLSDFMSKSDKNYNSYKIGLWRIDYQPSEGVDDKVTLYVVQSK